MMEWRFWCAPSLIAALGLASEGWAQTKADKHWAFQPVAKVQAPPLPPQWGNNSLDAWIHLQHKKHGMTPNPEANRRILLRRWTLDLLGLAPSPGDVDAFEKDASPDAYARVVERLLASPHYGERWGRHWLDVARWAESEGYESNHPRPFAWRYRDWVVRAFNQDKPFTAFVQEQIAGDEITPYADEHLIATGFLASARLSSNEEDRYRQRNDVYVDIVNATSAAFLGLTMQCAQCHEHRFDPISAKDYYRFMGFFVKGQPGDLALKDPRLWAEYEAKKPPGYDAALRERDELFERGRARRLAEIRRSFSRETQQALALPMERRSPAQEKLVRQADLLLNQFTAGAIEIGLDSAERQRHAELKKKVADFEQGMLAKPQTFGFYSPATSPHKVTVLPMKGFYPLAYAPQELAAAQPIFLSAGDVHQPNGVVEVGWPGFLGKTPPAGVAEKPRLALAQWLTSPKNPLTTRVYVNWVWQHHFGRGIVATAGDFGLKGAAPTHPELLDWLVEEFRRSGGSTKHLHRLIVTSATYRQSAAPHAENLKRDPENKFWWRWERRRLEAEAIRDALLAVSGDLDRTVGGPSETDKSLRRGLYLFQKRDLPPQQQALFDGPAAMTESCSRRHTSTVPLQSLYLLNSAFSMQRAQALAGRVRQQAGADRAKQVEAAFGLVLARAPEDVERRLARRFFASVDGEPEAALTQFCQALLNLNEFVYLE